MSRSLSELGLDKTYLSFIIVGGSDAITAAKSAAGVAQLAFGYDFQGLSAIGRYDSTGTAVTSTVCLRHDPLGRLTLVGPPTTAGFAPNGLICLKDSEVKAPTARFKYDGFGRRVARWLARSGEWTYVISDTAGRPLSELAMTGNAAAPWRRVRDYVWVGDMPVAQVEYPGPPGSSAGYVYYFHVDGIGLPRALTNGNGQVVWSATWRPYGDVVESTSTDPLSGRAVVTNLRYPGQYDERLLGSLGLQGPYYNWNRWYLPGVGRYLEPDPIALAGGFNGEFGPDWYNYAAENPLRYIDPTGRDRYDPCADWPSGTQWICKKYIVDKACDANVAGRVACCQADERTCHFNFAPEDTEMQNLCAALEKACEATGEFKQPPKRPKPQCQ